jgi:hypothetical protein
MRFASANKLHRKSGGANSGFPTTLLSQTTTSAASFEESRMRFTESTKPDRKPGGRRGICGAHSFVSPPCILERRTKSGHG